MNRNFLIQLTSAVYRLTLFFPKKEPLRYKIRELADDILAGPNEKDLEVLDNFFEVASVQNWVSPADILAIKEEYDNLRKTLGEDDIKQEKKETTVLNHNNSDAEQGEVKKRTEFSSPRKEKIMTFLKENGRAQVWQAKQFLPDVSKRTLRRDFEDMLEQGLIERVGERNDTFYKLKENKSSFRPFAGAREIKAG